MEKQEFTLSREKAIRYLNLYVGESDWERHIADLYTRLARQHGTDEAKRLVRDRIAFSVMAPEIDKVRLPENAYEILFVCHTWSQFKVRDWTQELQKRLTEDEEIEKWRNQSLSLGIVYPIDYSPVTRQAFNWLYSRAEDSGAVTPENKKDMQRRFQNLVLAYGGNVICSIFIKEDHKVGKKVLNWHSNYFFERLIFDTYDVDQVLKIKRQELKKTNPKLVKRVRQD